MCSQDAEEAMPCWYYDEMELRSTPSVKDGMHPEVESRYRNEGARFIMDTGTTMGLRHYETLATGIIFFHRFYMIHSFKNFPKYVTGCCCLFLAGKVEETPKKCKDIIKAARSLLSDQDFAQFGDDPKEEVMTLECILLQTIKFDLQVEHPYRFLLKYAKCIKEGDKQKIESMVQMAWTFVNDSLFTTLCLQWEPEIIAIAVIYLASKLCKLEVTDWVDRQPRHKRWWDMFVDNISQEILEDVCHQVLDIYSSSARVGAAGAAASSNHPPSSNNHGVLMKVSHNNPHQIMQPLQVQIPMAAGLSANNCLISPGLMHGAQMMMSDNVINVNGQINGSIDRAEQFMPNLMPRATLLARSQQMDSVSADLSRLHQQQQQQLSYKYSSVHTTVPSLIDQYRHASYGLSAVSTYQQQIYGDDRLSSAQNLTSTSNGGHHQYARQAQLNPLVTQSVAEPERYLKPLMDNGVDYAKGYDSYGSSAYGSSSQQTTMASSTQSAMHFSNNYAQAQTSYVSNNVQSSISGVGTGSNYDYPTTGTPSHNSNSNPNLRPNW